MNSHTYEEDVTVETPKISKPGTYIAYVEFDWSNSAICNDFSFRVYSNAQVSIEEISQAVYPNFLNASFCDYAKKNATLENV